MRIRRILQIAAFLLPTAAAANPEYNYVQGALLDHNAQRDDDGGVSFAGSLAALPVLALIGEHAGTGDFDHTSVGLLFHVPLLRGLDVNIGGTFDSVKFGNSDDNGQGMRGGLRWRPVIPGVGDRFELSPEVRRTYIFNQSETSFRAGALIRLAWALDFFGAVQTGDDDRFELGVRYNFKPPQDFAALERAEAEKDAADRLAMYDTAYRGALDAIRDAERLKGLEAAAAEKRAAELRAAARKAAAERRAKTATASRKQETAKPALECTPECCAGLQEQSLLKRSPNSVNGLAAK